MSSANASNIDAPREQLFYEVLASILSTNFVSNNLTFIPSYKEAAPPKPSLSNINQTLFWGPHYSKAPEPDYFEVLDDEQSLIKSVGFHLYSNHNLFWPPPRQQFAKQAIQ